LNEEALIPHKISLVEQGAPAAALGVRPGEYLLAIDGRPVADVFDYRVMTREKTLTLTIRSEGGQQRLLRVEKPEDADLGLVFESGLMTEPRSCSNKCVFCFIDQLPQGLRPTLYYKDDDMRLSFLSGNYVTLTNMPESEIDRLIAHRLSPVNISVHASDPAVRAVMLKNPRAARIMEHIRRFADAGIKMNFQIVLCKGINDGAVLERTVRDLAGFVPAAQSLSVVPAGLTKYREERGLPHIAAHTPKDAREIAATVEKWQAEFLARYGTRFVYAADEFYVKAGLVGRMASCSPMQPGLAGRGASCSVVRPGLGFPPYESYEDFPQIENGVGMLAEFEREVADELEDFAARKNRRAQRGAASRNSFSERQAALNTRNDTAVSRNELNRPSPDDYPQISEVTTSVISRNELNQPSPDVGKDDENHAIVSVVTGIAAERFMKTLCARAEAAFPGLEIRVHAVRNDFFGENVTVSGLLTGRDIVGQLKGKPLGERLLIPGNALRYGEDVFLDDMTLREAQDALGVKAVRVAPEGRAFVRAATAGMRLGGTHE